jgi:hypothetical protein
MSIQSLCDSPPTYVIRSLWFLLGYVILKDLHQFVVGNDAIDIWKYVYAGIFLAFGYLRRNEAAR